MKNITRNYWGYSISNLDICFWWCETNPQNRTFTNPWRRYLLVMEHKLWNITIFSYINHLWMSYVQELCSITRGWLSFTMFCQFRICTVYIYDIPNWKPKKEQVHYIALQVLFICRLDDANEAKGTHAKACWGGWVDKSEKSNTESGVPQEVPSVQI